MENNDTLTVSEVKTRSVSGVLALISRTFIVQIISFVATLVLTLYLDPQTYGIFYLVSSVVNFLSYFSDIGLAAALVQKSGQLSRRDLATTFSLQQILVLTSLTVLYFLTPFLKRTYSLDGDGVFLLFAMGTSFLLSSLKTIPSIMLEREIKFNKLIIPQVLETLVFNIVAVYCALNGMGVNSFSYAVLARGIVGLIAVYIVYPWVPQIGIYRESLSSLLKFGIPYQTNTILAILKDDGITILLTKIIGTSGLGYIGWASKWSGLPLRIVMDNLSKVSFPAFARLQNDKEQLTKAVEVSLKYLTLVIFPILIGMGFIAQPLAMAIPRYQKWLPAIIPLYFYLYNSGWASISTSLTNLLNATGNIKVTFKLMLMWTSLTWLTMPILATRYGFMGAAYATAIIATSSYVTIFLTNKIVKLNFVKILKTSVISSLVMSAFLYPSLRLAGQNPYFILALFAISFAIYGISVLFIEGKQFFITTKNYFSLKHV